MICVSGSCRERGKRRWLYVSYCGKTAASDLRIKYQTSSLGLMNWWDFIY